MPSNYAAKKAGYRAQNGKIKHFGDARDEFITAKMNGDFDRASPCTSKGMSTMPVRERGPHNKSGYVPA
tara:strand:- start:533 stop:739 length:207 start_codon:yes stop_codon:yes gene_type:complete